MSSLAILAIVLISFLGEQESDYDRAYQQSVATGRPLVVLLGAPWCPACQQLKNNVLPQIADAGGLKHVEFAYVDCDRQPDLAARLRRGDYIPQLIRFDQQPSGWDRRFLIGARSTQEIQAFLGPESTVQTDRATSSRNASQEDFARAYNRSLANGRPLVVLLGAKWCPACQKMKNTVLPQVAKAGGLENVEFVYVDCGRQADLAAHLGRGNSIPQLIRLENTPNGWSSRVLVGAKTPREVRSFINAGVATTTDQRHLGSSVPDKTASSGPYDRATVSTIRRPRASEVYSTRKTTTLR